jgi:hypothetical protein
MSVQLFAIKIVDSNIDSNQVDWRFVFAGSKADAASKVATEKPGLVPIAIYEPVVLGEEKVQPRLPMEQPSAAITP